MNHFDNECNIIELFQEIKDSKVLFLPFESETVISVFERIHDAENWNKWTDSSGKSDIPPDFFCDEFCYMMEVMRMDDHAYLTENGKYINPTNERESMLRKEIMEKIDISPTQKLFINAITDLPTHKDHNYRFYRDNFTRIIEHHKSKIKQYRENHPDYKLIFFVLDESSGYFRSQFPANLLPSFYKNKITFGMPHYHFYDRAFLDPIINSDIDFLIWHTPFKYYGTNMGKLDLPEACVFDVKSMKIETKEYDPKYMISTEV